MLIVIKLPESFVIIKVSILILVDKMRSAVPVFGTVVISIIVSVAVTGDGNVFEVSLLVCRNDEATGREFKIYTCGHLVVKSSQQFLMATGAPVVSAVIPIVCSILVSVV